MATLVTDRLLAEELIQQRRANGSDRWDEVWEGTYVMTPLPNDEHQQIVSRLTSIFEEVIGWPGLGDVRPGVNVTDREDDWTANYRCPDVAVYLQDTHAENRDTHWLGGPDFLVEVVSPDDRTRDKLDFYAKVGTREMLVVDRAPWSLELYRLSGSELKLTVTSSVASPTVLSSEVVPLSFALASGKTRPEIEVSTTDGSKSWSV